MAYVTDTLPQRVTRIPVADPGRAFATLDGLAATVARVVSSGRYVHGPEHAAFEAKLAAFLGLGHCLGVASGTDALQLALAGVGCEPGDEIVTAANAGGYGTAAALRMGLVPRYADVDPITLNVSAATIEAALTPATRAVIATHLYGLLCEVEAIVELCRFRGIAVVEDCAQAAGAQRGGARAGSFGDAAAFSFYPTKNLAALGDGGAVTTNDDRVADRVRQLRQYGWGEKYRVSLAGGWNSRLDELQAAVLELGLAHLDEGNARRRDIVRRYSAALPPEAGHFVSSGGEDFVAHLAVIVTSDRAVVQERLDRVGVDTGIHYPTADYDQPAWPGAVRLPVTDDAVKRVLTVPCFPELTDDEVDRVCEALDGL